ncbi:hypothetical protein KOW79_001873 [Hemibagrus wyckioides]|uniref:Chromo domain-containing protein n=1 Tax=Hemibagrus wyckioides TaxID=337641 RepID=A0A9D3P670_9TELE|nr:hypothetical protein KOW79_001873 [Hemibagrus wyckioides]
MLALTSAGYCAYRWLKRSSDLQAAELQAAHEPEISSPPEIDADSSVYQVREVMNSRQRGGCLQYLIDWEGFLQSDTDPVTIKPDPSHKLTCTASGFDFSSVCSLFLQSDTDRV